MLRFALNVLAPSGANSRLSVLIYHRVPAAQDSLLSDEPDAARFEQQLRWVRDWFHVVPLVDAVAGMRKGDLPARPLCITFDDGYADNATVALPILRKLGLSATFFIATGYLNGGRMWNDTVIEAVRAATGRLDLSDLGLGSFSLDGVLAKREAIDSILEDLKHLPWSERQRKADALATRVGAELPDDLMMTDEQVLQLHAAGMTIGAHTVTHPILAKIDDETARGEILESKAYLECLLREPITLFAYPNGMPARDYTAAHVEMIRSFGFQAAVSTAAGAAHPGCDLFQIPRFTPWDRTQLRFGLRLARNARRTEWATV